MNGVGGVCVFGSVLLVSLVYLLLVSFFCFYQYVPCCDVCAPCYAESAMIDSL